MKKWLNKSNIRILFSLIFILLALPLGWKEITGLSAWLSPFIMLNSVILLKSFVWLNSLGLIILILCWFNKRWFCRTMCPVGLACDAVSKLKIRKNFSLLRIPRIARWLAIISPGAALTGIPLFILLDPMAIFNSFFSVFSEGLSIVAILSFSVLPLLLIINIFFPEVWCARICPLGGIQDELIGIKAVIYKKRRRDINHKKAISAGRRLFVAWGAGVISGLIIPGWLKSSSANCFRPPASIENSIFNTLCIRCGNCIKACPSKIIIHHSDKSDPVSWMTPEISFKSYGYCLEDCNLCGTVCPSGAISPFNLEAKKQLFIASIEIEIDKCLLTNQTECERCKIVCSYDAIEIIPGDFPLIMKPSVDFRKCVGCGACAAICPPLVIKMVPPVINSSYG
jgi:ferredoxin-type protein NapF